GAGAAFLLPGRGRGRAGAVPVLRLAHRRRAGGGGARGPAGGVQGVRLERRARSVRGTDVPAEQDRPRPQGCASAGVAQGALEAAAGAPVPRGRRARGRARLGPGPDAPAPSVVARSVRGVRRGALPGPAALGPLARAPRFRLREPRRRPDPVPGARRRRAGARVRLKIVPLGTSAGRPTLLRGASALAVATEGAWVMCDCGEGAQLAALRAGLALSRLEAVLITHLHRDHFNGPPRLLGTPGPEGPPRPRGGARPP